MIINLHLAILSLLFCLLQSIAQIFLRLQRFNLFVSVTAWFVKYSPLHTKTRETSTLWLNNIQRNLYLFSVNSVSLAEYFFINQEHLIKLFSRISGISKASLLFGLKFPFFINSENITSSDKRTIFVCLPGKKAYPDLPNKCWSNCLNNFHLT
jgi:hypothetical protein